MFSAPFLQMGEFVFSYEVITINREKKMKNLSLKNINTSKRKKVSCDDKNLGNK